MSDAHSTHLSVSGYSNRFLHSTEQTLRNMLRPVVRAHSRSISELLAQVEEVTTPAQLTKLVNKVQVRPFKLPALHDEKISEHLLPVALRWSGDDDSERRSRIAYILCKMNQPAAQEALL